MTVFAEGIDYSSTPNDNWSALAAALRAEGKSFAGRYAVYDKSPDGRGITADEYHALTAHGIDCFLYYEENTSWMTGGWSAGVRAATRALDNIRNAGMPEGMPVYYSDDAPPETDDFDAVIECLRGTASIVGPDRVALYGGWDAIDHAQAAGAARFYCQTIAWQYGRGLHPGIHLHQYNTGQPSAIYIGGVDVDLVAAIQPHYGQASDYLGITPTTTTTTTPAPQPKPAKLPKGMSTGVVKTLFNPRDIRPTPHEPVAHFVLTGTISQAWLKHGIETIPAGGTWKEGKWPELTQVVIRGDGRRDWVFSDGWVFEQGHKV